MITLKRYNGASHSHPNHLEGNRLGFETHIHFATEKYIKANRKPEGFAQATKKYKTLEGAFHCLITDCKISGMDTKADDLAQQKLFFKMNTLDVNKLEEQLRALFCTNLKLVEKKAGLILIDTPFYFPDGDPYQIYMKEMPGGIFRLTDMGHTLMHLSYENEIIKFREGTRGKIFEQIKAEHDLIEN